MGREQEREKKDKGELSGKKESIGKHKESLSERKMNVYAKMSYMKKTLTMRQLLPILMYKDILIASNRIDNSLPSVIVDIL